MRITKTLMCFLLLSMQTGFSWFHCPPILHLRVSGPSSQNPSLQIYFTVEIQVNGPCPSIWPLSIDPGLSQWWAEFEYIEVVMLSHVLWKYVFLDWMCLLELLENKTFFMFLLTAAALMHGWPLSVTLTRRNPTSSVTHITYISDVGPE